MENLNVCLILYLMMMMMSTFFNELIQWILFLTFFIPALLLFQFSAQLGRPTRQHFVHLRLETVGPGHGRRYSHCHRHNTKIQFYLMTWCNKRCTGAVQSKYPTNYCCVSLLFVGVIKNVLVKIPTDKSRLRLRWSVVNDVRLFMSRMKHFN